jgi:hypothetical protein
MTKKHFIELADWLRKPGMIPGSVEHAIRSAAPDISDATVTHIKQDVMGAVVRDLASFCLHQNSRFDRERFLSYIAGECGPNGGRIS